MGTDDVLKKCMQETAHGLDGPGLEECPRCAGTTRAPEGPPEPPENADPPPESEEDASKAAIEAQIKAYEEEKAAEAELVKMLDEFPLSPAGDRIVLYQELPEHMTAGGLVLVRDESMMPLVGYVVAVPSNDDPTGSHTCPFKYGDKIIFPDHCFSRIAIDVLGRVRPFLVLDYHDAIGVLKGASVESVGSLVSGIEHDDPMTAEEIRGSS